MANQAPGWSTLLGMGVAVGGQLAFFLVLGLVVDALAGTSPVFLLIGVLLGVVGAISFAVVKFRQYLPGTTPTARPDTTSEEQ